MKVHGVQPDRRYHYRHVAADLALAAARLLPRNTDRAARWLCIAGSWIKSQDPKTADRFYKALVREHGKTDLGKEADRLRWFPPLGTKDG